jgi:hypothetical protein
MRSCLRGWGLNFDIVGRGRCHRTRHASELRLPDHDISLLPSYWELVASKFVKLEISKSMRRESSVANFKLLSSRGCSCSPTIETMAYIAHSNLLTRPEI